MKRTPEMIQYISDNINILYDREMATILNVNYVTIFNIKKKFKIERSKEFTHERRILAGRKAGTSTQAKHEMRGENNPYWKGGRSKDWRNYPSQKGKYPIREKARKYLNHQIERGKMKKQPCIFCGDLKVEAHHEDYSQPLLVVWVCKKHHEDIHHNRLTQADKEFLTAQVLKAGEMLITPPQLTISDPQ